MSGAAVDYRPMRPDDGREVHALAQRAFQDLAHRLGQPPWPSPPEAAGVRRVVHLVGTDPAGAHVAESGGRLVGAALALRRESLWGLSLLVVDPDTQSAGVGSTLLARALAYAEGTRGALILSSEDSRALRTYARAGFAAHPELEGVGVPRRLERPGSVREGTVADRELVERIDRAVRGAARGPDLDVMLELDPDFLVVEGRGYALVGGGQVRLLAALDEGAAQDLLRAAIAGVAHGERMIVTWVTAQQGWALPVLLDAGLELRTGGAVFVRGDVGPLRPYLPSGAFL